MKNQIKINLVRILMKKTKKGSISLEIFLQLYRGQSLVSEKEHKTDIKLE